MNRQRRSAACGRSWIRTIRRKQGRCCAREGIPEEREKDYVGLWTPEDEPPPTILGLPAWAQARNVEAVVWTALPHSFDKDRRERIASSDEIAAYLAVLTGSLRDDERYIRNVPPQIDTPYRRAIEAKLGWTGRDHG